MPRFRNFIFGMLVHHDNIKVTFEYQGYWVKVKVMIVFNIFQVAEKLY